MFAPQIFMEDSPGKMWMVMRGCVLEKNLVNGKRWEGVHAKKSNTGSRIWV